MNSSSAPLFLTPDELRQLTGRARRDAQVEWLRTSGLPYHVNAAGKPVVARAHFTGPIPSAPAPEPAWTPAVARKAG